MSGNREREAWVDIVKVSACILVVVGHFLQSIVPELIPAENRLAEWFDRTIYYFHVPLFFICSGYVYQRYGKIDSLKAYWANMKKKIVTLGIPYAVFTIITWLLKTAFADEVTYRIDGLGSVLLLKPISPYWFLYALLLVFAITPTLKSRRTGVLAFGIAVLMYLIGCEYGERLPEGVEYILLNEIWFVSGMNLCFIGFGKRRLIGCFWSGVAAGALFVLLSVWLFCADVRMAVVDLLMGALGCGMTILIAYRFSDSERGKVFSAAVKWSMPVFLMHTIFAAPVRIVLLKLQVRNLPVHVAAGLAASFIGPVIAAEIAGRIKWLDICLNPGRYIRS